MLQMLTRTASLLAYESTAGLMLSLTLLPEALMLAFIAGLAPLTGLYSAGCFLLLITLFGGRPAMAACTTPALALVMADILVNYGLDYVFAAVLVMGALQLLAGFFRLGKFVRMLPPGVLLGFVLGLGALLFWQQLQYFRQSPLNNVAASQNAWLAGEPLLIMLGLVLGTLLLWRLLPQFLPRWLSNLALLGTLIGTSLYFPFDTLLLGELGSWSGSLPSFNLPKLGMAPLDWLVVLAYGALLALLGMSEALLTLSLADELSNTRGRSNQECLAQGVANITNACLGGMAASAHFGQTLVNLYLGGRTRLSTLIAAATLLTLAWYGGTLIAQVPVGILVGLVLLANLSVLEWALIRLARKARHQDLLIALIMAGVIISTNLIWGVLAGIILAALSFAWEHAKQMRIIPLDEGEQRIYLLQGPLFFASANSFLQQFDPSRDPQQVVVDFRYSRVYDHSGVKAIEQLAARYTQANKRLQLRHLSSECRALLNAQANNLVLVDSFADPRYQVASDLS
ncbi:SulP family inorganic anion transporter [Balneatrix alpica]|uniref:SulP family inorganic anion transporter n=1 Tax=Balneatrix alpica TaxID=75684 RepID=A0ABV5ZDC0_9GAMM|nr:SulP family inorganic anion transporter [Balneatrix alpica]